MQTSRLPNFPPLCSSFKKHRSSIDHSGFQIDLTLPKPISGPFWAPLPTPPMSGSPPPGISKDPPQLAGRRRNRSESPPLHTSAASAIFPPISIERSAPRPIAQIRGGRALGDVALQHSQYAQSYPTPPPPGPSSFGAGTAMPIAPMTASVPQFSPGQVSPRSTRKTKAHVASACINCKKKHLRCDNTRPCRRCVQSGKEDSCVDVEHKKRGRPPLKPDDPSSRRPFDSALGPMTGQLVDPTRRMPPTEQPTFSQPSSYQRAFRPLQAVPPYDPTGPRSRASMPFPPMYAQASVSPSSAMATGTMTRAYMPSSAPPQPPSPYVAAPEGPPRQFPPYSESYSYSQPQSYLGPPSQPPYSNPLFPRSTPPQTTQSGPLNISDPGNLQLPPIRPAASASPLDPAIMQTERLQAQSLPPPIRESRSNDDSMRAPDPKRPKMDIQGILGPRTD